MTIPLSEQQQEAPTGAHGGEADRSEPKAGGETLRERVAETLWNRQRDRLRGFHGRRIMPNWRATMPEEREPCLGDADAILALLPPPVPRKVEEALTEARVLAAKLIEECIWPTSAGRVLAQVDAALSTLSALRQPSALDNARTPGHPDAYLNALLDYTSGFYASAIAHGMKAGPAADAVQHVERAARGLHALALAAQPSALDSGDGGEVGR